MLPAKAVAAVERSLERRVGVQQQPAAANSAKAVAPAASARSSPPLCVSSAVIRRLIAAAAASRGASACAAATASSLNVSLPRRRAMAMLLTSWGVCTSLKNSVWQNPCSASHA